MGIKEQFKKLKDNWLVVVLVVVLFLFFSGSNLLSGLTMQAADFSRSNSLMAESVMSKSSGGGYYPQPQTDFAPDVQERKIIKTAYLSTEVGRGTFSNSEATLKNIVTSSNSFILNEDVNRYGEDNKAYYTGSYQIKVEVGKYDAVVAQLKQIGKVQSFSEDSYDITGSYTNTQIELATEKSRLARYESMYKEATLVADKITLNDRIFDQERTIKYLEDSLTNVDRQVEYSTISFTMNEKQSEYSNIIFVKFSELIQSLVGSFNNLITLIFVLLPWAVGALIIWAIVKVVRRKR